METERSPAPLPGSDFVRALDRGLAVIRAFADTKRELTLAEVAEQTGLSRPTARRFLSTLDALGYVEYTGRTYRLLPRVLDLGYSYMHSFGLPDLVQPFVEALNARLQEACSVAVLDRDSIVYIARANSQRIMTISLRVGTRLGVDGSSLGRVLLAGLPPEELDEHLRAYPRRKLTPRTVVDEDELRRALDTVREQGWAFVDEEIEEGVRTLAAPIRNADGRTIAALNIATHTSRVPISRLMEEFLPLLLETRDRIEQEVRIRGIR